MGTGMSADVTASQSVVGLAWSGSFTVDPVDHARFCAATFAEDWTAPTTHPIYLHLVAHCGKGVDLTTFFAALGTSLEAGVTFGEGRLETHHPLLVGETYAVNTAVTECVRKSGRRGPFDVVTCRIEVSDPAGVVCGTSTEAFIVPRSSDA
jgi:N-terminal half of MaoC dehydratase